MNDKSELSNMIKAEAKSLGFYACGIAKAEPVEKRWADLYMKNLEQGHYGNMAYLGNNIEKRLDPRLLVEGVKSIIVVAMSYAPAHSQSSDTYKIANYALGKDYHDIVKERLRQLSDKIANNSSLLTPHSSLKENSSLKEGWRVFVDTAPVMERYWAVKAGLGWIGKNSQLIIPHAGSMFFLGEIFVDIELAYDSPLPSHCGNCQLCIDACPSGAIGHQKKDMPSFDARKCLSYLTIENREDIPSEYASKMGDCFYGCDRCQQACPWNKFAIPTTEPLLQPSPELLAMTKEDWENLTVEKYRSLFKGSAVKRAKYEGVMRNINCVQQYK